MDAARIADARPWQSYIVALVPPVVVKIMGLQVWATWLLYATLVDISDAIAQQLDLPLDRISLDMTYRGIYHFTRAQARGETTDLITYLATQKDLAVVKTIRKHKTRQKGNLDLLLWPQTCYQ